MKRRPVTTRIGAVLLASLALSWSPAAASRVSREDPCSSHTAAVLMTGVSHHGGTPCHHTQAVRCEPGGCATTATLQADAATVVNTAPPLVAIPFPDSRGRVTHAAVAPPTPPPNR